MKNYLIVYMMFLCSFAEGQDLLHLNVEQLIAKCKNSSLELKRQQLNLSLAEAEVQSAKEWWLPEVFVGTNFHHLDGSAMNGDGRFFTEVDRQNRWYGGEINVDWDLGKGLYKTKAKKLFAESIRFANKTNKDQEIIESIASYYELLVADTEVKIYEELISEKAALINQLEVQVTAGLRLESELLLAKSNLQRLKLESISSYQTEAGASLQVLSALNISDQVIIQGDLEDLKMISLVELENLEAYKVNEHPRSQAFQMQIEAQEKETAMHNKSLLFPKAGLRYNYGPFGADYSDTETTRGLQGYLGWNIPLGQVFYNGNGKASKVKEALVQLELQEQRLLLTQQVATYKEQLLRLKTLLELSDEGGNYAKLAHDQALSRQQEGLGSTYEVLQAQEEFIKAKLMHLRMIANHNLLQYQLMVALGKSI